MSGVVYCEMCTEMRVSRAHWFLMELIRAYVEDHPGASATEIRRALGASRSAFAEALDEELSDFPESDLVLVKKGRGLHLVKRSELGATADHTKHVDSVEDLFR